MPTARDMYLARAQRRAEMGEEIFKIKNAKLIKDAEHREDVAGKHAKSSADLEAKRNMIKDASPRKMVMIGGAGGHEGGAPSPQAKRYVEKRVSSEHASPVKSRPADREYGPDIRGKTVRTTGMSSEITDKASPAGRRNTAGQQPNPMSGHGGRYVSEDMMTNNSRPPPSSALSPRSPYSGKLGYKEGGIVKAKRVGKPSAWISHVKAYQQQHGVSYREAMIGAKATYQK